MNKTNVGSHLPSVVEPLSADGGAGVDGDLLGDRDVVDVAGNISAGQVLDRAVAGGLADVDTSTLTYAMMSALALVSR